MTRKCKHKLNLALNKGKRQGDDEGKQNKAAQKNKVPLEAQLLDQLTHWLSFAT